MRREERRRGSKEEKRGDQRCGKGGENGRKRRRGREGRK